MLLQKKDTARILFVTLFSYYFYYKSSGFYFFLLGVVTVTDFLPEIVAQAGKLGAVTIATNMAGRGTDIILGGNAEYMAKAAMRKQGFTEEYPFGGDPRCGCKTAAVVFAAADRRHA